MQKAVLTSIWNNFKSKAAVRANKTRSVVILTTGEKTSWKSMPSFWAYPLVTSLALYLGLHQHFLFCIPICLEWPSYLWATQPNPTYHLHARPLSLPAWLIPTSSCAHIVLPLYK